MSRTHFASEVGQFPIRSDCFAGSQFHHFPAVHVADNVAYTAAPCARYCLHSLLRSLTAIAVRTPPLSWLERGCY